MLKRQNVETAPRGDAGQFPIADFRLSIERRQPDGPESEIDNRQCAGRTHVGALRVVRFE